MRIEQASRAPWISLDKRTLSIANDGLVALETRRRDLARGPALDL
jgi:hypothetical protein